MRGSYEAQDRYKWDKWFMSVQITHTISRIYCNRNLRVERQLKMTLPIARDASVEGKLACSKHEKWNSARDGIRNRRFWNVRLQNNNCTTIDTPSDKSVSTVHSTLVSDDNGIYWWKELLCMALKYSVKKNKNKLRLYKAKLTPKLRLPSHMKHGSSCRETQISQQRPDFTIQPLVHIQASLRSYQQIPHRSRGMRFIPTSS